MKRKENSCIYLQLGEINVAILDDRMYLVCNSDTKLCKVEENALQVKIIKNNGRVTTKEEFENSLNRASEKNTKSLFISLAYICQLQALKNSEEAETKEFINYGELRSIELSRSTINNEDVVVLVKTQQGDFISNQIRTESKGISGEFTRIDL